MKELLFSFEGRVGRKTWWLATLGIIAAVIAVQVLMAVLATMSETAGLIGAIFALAVCLALVVPSLAITAKRWHDVDKSGWWLLLGFVPVANLYALVMTGFIKGTEGRNQYGENPVAEGIAGYPRTA